MVFIKHIRLTGFVLMRLAIVALAVLASSVYAAETTEDVNSAAHGAGAPARLSGPSPQKVPSPLLLP
jgi:hypothetical protein